MDSWEPSSACNQYHFILNETYKNIIAGKKPEYTPGQFLKAYNEIYNIEIKNPTSKVFLKNDSSASDLYRIKHIMDAYYIRVSAIEQASKYADLFE